MTPIMREMSKSLPPEHKALARQLSRSMKRPVVNNNLVLIKDNLVGLAGRTNTELRHLMTRNLWAVTENFADQFDRAGGSELFKSTAPKLYRDTPLNDRQLVHLEYQQICRFLGEETAKKIGLGPRNLQQIANDATDYKLSRIITKRWTLHHAMTTCGCRPAPMVVLDTELAAYSFGKAIAIAALIAADAAAFSTPASVPLAAISFAYVAYLLHKSC